MTTILNQKDFASTAGLPDWGRGYIENLTREYAAPTWANYESGPRLLYNTQPGQIESARRASEAKYVSDMQRGLGEAARKTAFTTAARGTGRSSVGEDLTSQMAWAAIDSAQKQHQEANVGAAEANYQKKVDYAAATQGMSQLSAGYLGNTAQAREVDFGDLNLDPGTSSEPNNPTENAALQTAKDIIQTLNAEDLAARTGLEPFAENATRDIVDQYGRQSITDAYNANLDLAGANWDMENQGRNLQAQYGGLSDTTMALLKSALASSGVQAGGQGINDAAAQGKVRTAMDTTRWTTDMKRRAAVDATNSASALASQIGTYLGLTRYKYDPNLDSYLNLVGSLGYQGPVGPTFGPGSTFPAPWGTR